jgi:hypothetical protein
MNDHRCMRDIPASDVAHAASRVLAETGLAITNSSFRDGA